MLEIGAIGHGVAAASFVLLAIVLFMAWRGRWQSKALVATCIVSALWAVSVSYQSAHEIHDSLQTRALELLRNGAWLGFLYAYLMSAEPGPRIARPLIVACVMTGTILLAMELILFLQIQTAIILPEVISFDLWMLGNIILVVIGLALIEQLFRNTGSEEQRWGIKFFCLGLGGLFAYDFYMYADALLFKEVDENIWVGRGIITVLVIPLIALSAGRKHAWASQISLSRQFIFRSTAITAVGLYLLIMAAGGYYVRLYGGTWGGVAQATFLFGSLLVLLVVLFSGQMRARLRVFLGKHFYHYKYDHREEWLRIIRGLSTKQSNRDLRESAIRVIADTVNSPAGMLWLRRNDQYELLANWNMVRPRVHAEHITGPLARFLQNWQWIIDLDEYRHEPDIYRDLELPEWLTGLPDAWLVVPLMHQTDLLGFVIVSRALAKMKINWEDRDLLLTAGRQAASYMALVDANEALAEARQFEAFNRLSAYVVHDLKNLGAQLSMVVSNARKFKDNPDFMNDAISTLENAAGKMNRMLNQLRKGRTEVGSAEQVNLQGLLAKVIKLRSNDLPVPEFHHEGFNINVLADPDRLAAVIEHLVQNAQEATPGSGSVKVLLSATDPGQAIIVITDSGKGMSDQFIRERLFRPFDTTKGNAGMGIGAYESRELIQMLGGTIEVRSQLERGTIFTIRLPRAQARLVSVDKIISDNAIV